jgi:hypothetical protein
MRGIFLIISAFLLPDEFTLNHVRFTGRYPADGIGRTDGCNGALVTVQTAVVPDLHMQGTVTKGGTPFYTLGATDAELLINDIFKIGFLDKPALNGCSWTELILGTGFPFSPRFEIASAKITVSTQVIGMHTL